MITNRAGRVLATAVAAMVLGGGCTAGPGPAAPLPREVTVSTGTLAGTDGDAVRRFHGIPYAAPPTGERRLAAPQPPSPWAGVRDATRPGPVCAQPSGDPAAPVRGTEDCLTLDVTAPVTPSPTPRPVLVWLHGGGLSAGDGAEVDPSRMVRGGDVIVVSVEFRLGALGFLGHPSLGDDAGTLGFADQQAALRWVRAEIGAFGGDPGRVTLAGESGGAIGVCAQLLSPGARGLFDRAIPQSGSCLMPLPYLLPRKRSADQAGAVAARLGCTDPATTAACLRRLPVNVLVPGGADVIGAAWGGPLLPRDPADALRDPSAIAPVPVLSGHNRDEGTVFAQTADILQTPVTDATMADRVAEQVGIDRDRAARIAAAYPPEPNPGYRFGAITGDGAFACPQQALAEDLSRRAEPVYAYEFADRTSPGYVPILDSYRPVGASHASELPYLFDLRDKPIDFTGAPRPLDATQRALGDTMIDHWTRFVRDGDPGWSRYDAGAPQARSFAPRSDGGVAEVDPTGRHRCGAWAG